MELTPFLCALLCLRGVVLYLRLRWVVLGCPALAFSFVLRFGDAFPSLQIGRSKVSLLLFKIMLHLKNVSVGSAKRGDV